MKISAEKGKANKMHISIDGEYCFTVDADFWFLCGWLNGDEIDEPSLVELKNRVAVRRCYNRALNILSRRDHCEKELLQKLIRQDGEAAALAAVAKVRELGLINDERYARAFARELAQRKGMSKRGICAQLVHRGVDREVAKTAADETGLDECDKIGLLLKGKYSRRLADEKGRRQVVNALQRLGYSYSDIRAAMRDYEQLSEDDYE